MTIYILGAFMSWLSRLFGGQPLTSAVCQSCHHHFTFDFTTGEFNQVAE